MLPCLVPHACMQTAYCRRAISHATVLSCSHFTFTCFPCLCICTCRFPLTVTACEWQIAPACGTQRAAATSFVSFPSNTPAGSLSFLAFHWLCCASIHFTRSTPTSSCSSHAVASWTAGERFTLHGRCRPALRRLPLCQNPHTIPSRLS